MLQADDLVQLLLKVREPAASRVENSDEAKSSFVETQFRGLLAETTRSMSPSASSATENWSSDAKEIIRKKNLTLPLDIRELAESGNLNPGLLSYRPQRSQVEWSLYPEIPMWTALEKRLLGILGQIKELVENNGGVCSF